MTHRIFVFIHRASRFHLLRRKTLVELRKGMYLKIKYSALFMINVGCQMGMLKQLLDTVVCSSIKLRVCASYLKLQKWSSSTIMIPKLEKEKR